MQADHNVVLARIGDQISQLRISIASAQQMLNRAVDDREHRRCTNIIQQRSAELAYWYDIAEFAQNNTVPSTTAAEQVRSDANTSRPTWLYGAARPAFTDAPEAMLRSKARDTLMRQARDTLKANNEQEQQHPTD